MRRNLLAVVVVLSSLAVAQESQQRRIVRPVNNASIVRLAGTFHPRVRNAMDQGAVSPTLRLQRMKMVFTLSSGQQAELDQLLAEQQDPASLNYHKWLTTEEYADRFGLGEADIAVISAWLSSQGFTIAEVSRGRNWIAFSGIAAQVEAAFRSPVHSYLVNGAQHYAPSSDIAVPDALEGVVSGVTGLDDFAPKALNVKPKARITSSLTGNHFMAPGDFATIYNLPSYSNGAVCTSPCNDGTGQTIAVVGQSQLSTDSNTGRNGTPGAVVNGQQQQYDLVTFRNLVGLPAVNLQIKLKGTDPGITSDADEANLDVEWAGATAPNAALIYYIENSNAGGAFQAMVDAVNDNLAQIISVSYGTCETQVDSSTFSALDTAGQQAAVQGQAIVVAAGDSGAADCDTTIPATQGLSADFPSSMPYATAIGGTAFTGDSANATDPTQPTQYWAGSSNDSSPSAFSYIPETTWNDTAGLTTGTISATGGGASVKYTKPTWQVGPGVPADNARDTPDVSFGASPSPDGYVICSQSSCVNGYRDSDPDTTYDVIGGTSAGVPAFAGILALINQSIGTRQGNINPQLYPLVQKYPLPGNPNTSWAFNDITSGDNKVVCTSGTGCSGGVVGYSAGTGYDQVTGLGTVDATALINALKNAPNPHFLVLPVSRSQFIDFGASTTVALSVTPKEGFTGNVALTCSFSSALTGASCSYDTPNVSAPGTANLTIGAGSITGAETGTVTLTGTSGNLTDSVAINLAVGVPSDFTLTVASPVVSIPSGTALTDSITVARTGGFSSDVTLTCSVPSSLGTTACLFPNGQSSTVITGGSGSVLATITGAVLSRDFGAPLPFNHRGYGTLAAFAFAVGIVFTSNPRRRRSAPMADFTRAPGSGSRPARRLAKVLLGFLAVFLLLSSISCGGGSNSGGGGNNPPNPITGNLTLTATGGGITHSTTINVTVF